MPLKKIHNYLFIILFLSILLSSYVAAEEDILIPAPPAIAAKSFIMIDSDSGKVLAEGNADTRLPPASLTKIMAVYVVFSELSKGHLNLNEMVTISQNAWHTEGSRMFAEVNKQIAVKDLLKGVIIQSGNDASVALAEHIAGNDATYAEMMNQQAKALGMENTHYTNSMGLPDPNHYTTARDLAKLTKALIRDFPEYYRWFSEKEFIYNNIKQTNRNRLLWMDETVDGVKTGHTEEAGYCLVASALREGMRLISVVMGTESDKARASENQTLLNYGYRFYETHRLYKAKEALTETRIWKGEEKNLKLGLAEDLFVTIPRRHYKDLKAAMNFEQKILAPVKLGDKLGTVNVTFTGQPLQEAKLIALTDIPEGNFFRKLVDAALMMVNK